MEQRLSLVLAQQQQRRGQARAAQVSPRTTSSSSGASTESTSSVHEASYLTPDPVLQASEPQQTPEPEAKEDCIICYDAVRCAVCVPCGHVAMCLSCARKVKSASRRVCPVCRARVSDIIKIFHV